MFKLIGFIIVIVGMLTSIFTLIFLSFDQLDQSESQLQSLAEEKANRLELQVLIAQNETEITKLKDALQLDYNQKLDGVMSMMIQQNRQVGYATNLAISVGQMMQNVWDTLYCEGFLEIPWYIHDAYMGTVNATGDAIIGQCTIYEARKESLDKLFKDQER